MANTVIGIFDSSSEAQQAVEQLISNGFTRSDIDMSSRSEDFGRTSTGTASTTSSYSDRRDDDSFGDKVSNFFSSLFDSDDDARTYSSVGTKGCVVTVHTHSMEEAERAADLLDRYGAVDVNEKAAQFGSTASTTNSFADRDIDARSTTDTSNSLPIIEEDLQVGKRIVETGGVRLRSRIVERPVEEHLRLRTEHVHVERTPVNRPASEADLNNFQEGTIEVREQAEMPVVNKTARVVEEVRLEKDVEERDETIRETLRGTDVDVENLSGTDRTRTDRTYGDSSLDDRNLNDRRYNDDADLNRPGSL
jgi:uncharacterized protein (TIGR02271 family)